MADNAPGPLSATHIAQYLETSLEVEFTFLHVDELATTIAELERHDQDFLLSWVGRIATTNIQIAYQFARHTVNGLTKLDQHVIGAWALHAMDTYDRAGMRPAIKVIKDMENFVRLAHERVAGVLLDEVSMIMLTFVCGLSGRKLKLEEGEVSHTDSETLFLPAVIAQMPRREDNFTLYKATVAFLWAQTRFGTFRADLARSMEAYPDKAKALQQFLSLETLRLEACLERELPGLFRDMQRLRQIAGETEFGSPTWNNYALELARPDATVFDSLRLLEEAYSEEMPPPACYQGELRPDAVAQTMAARLDREKMLLRVKLAQLHEEIARPKAPESSEPPAQFEIRPPEEGSSEAAPPELTLNDLPVAPPDDVRQLLNSIQLDLGEIPPEYLTPAGPGEYDPKLFEPNQADPNDVWQGTYHEEGATFYPEWDFGRQHFRKNWCVMREKDVQPVYDTFVADTLQKHYGLVKHLRRTFEAMRDENRMLKREASGDEVDIDALVEALADARDGSEMSDRLFMRTQRTERNIAVMFMVDMSGSTKGWINDAERESLILLCEALETLGDRYAIYGFSGITRKRCELYRIKRIDETYGKEVKARISGIRPQEYTRMGFAIRHLTSLLNDVHARTKLLITLSDGKPDDYNDGYRGKYGIEDTRKALQEAQRSGVHPFCITIDQEARDYLPHLYGAVNYTVVDEVRKLPLKVTDIYRRLTHR